MKYSTLHMNEEPDQRMKCHVVLLTTTLNEETEITTISDSSSIISPSKDLPSTITSLIITFPIGFRREIAMPTSPFFICFKSLVSTVSVMSVVRAILRSDFDLINQKNEPPSIMIVAKRVIVPAVAPMYVYA